MAMKSILHKRKEEDLYSQQNRMAQHDKEWNKDTL